MPFNSADVLILRYLMKQVNAEQTIVEFALINEKSGLNWPLGSRISSFFRRFWQNPYRESDTEWIKSLEIQYHINAIDMLRALNRCANEISKKQ